MALRATLAFLLAMLPAAMARGSGLELLMFEQPGCLYCARWNAEVAPEYPLTAEGRAAPLRRINLHADLPAGITLAAHPVFTPTFVVIRDGVETGRLEGYPGEDFFWPLLGSLLREAGASPLD